MAESKHSIITMVFSTLSGVGKTMVAINMAAGFAREGYKTCLIDLDLQFGDVANYLALEPGGMTIADAQEFLAVGQDEKIPSCLTDFYYQGTRFSVLPIPNKLINTYKIESEEITKIIDALDDYDYIILDTAANFSQVNLDMLDIATFVVFLGRTDFIPSIKTFKAGYDLLMRFNYAANKVRLLENFAGRNKVVAMRDVEKLLGRSFDMSFPYDKVAGECLWQGKPLILEPDKSPLGDALWEFVGYYTNRQIRHPREVKEKEGLFSKLKTLWS